MTASVMNQTRPAIATCAHCKRTLAGCRRSANRVAGSWPSRTGAAGRSAEQAFEIMDKLGLRRPHPGHPLPLAAAIATAPAGWRTLSLPVHRTICVL